MLIFVRNPGRDISFPIFVVVFVNLLWLMTNVLLKIEHILSSYWFYNPFVSLPMLDRVFSFDEIAM